MISAHKKDPKVFNKDFLQLILLCLCFQGDIGPAGAPGNPGKEGLVGPKVKGNMPSLILKNNPDV